MARRVTNSPEETLDLGVRYAARLKPPCVVALFGELGAGKTTFAKGLVSALANVPAHEVVSPTFTYLQIYPGPVHHFDLYRLLSAEEFLERGFEEFLEYGVVVIEWAERIERLLGSDVLRITLHHAGEGKREVIDDDTV